MNKEKRIEEIKQRLERIEERKNALYDYEGIKKKYKEKLKELQEILK